jgi:hypothetical protein
MGVLWPMGFAPCLPHFVSGRGESVAMHKGNDEMEVLAFLQGYYYLTAGTAALVSLWLTLK